MKRLSIRVCKKLKDAGFNVPTYGCYAYDSYNLVWNYFEDAVLDGCENSSNFFTIYPGVELKDLIEFSYFLIEDKEETISDYSKKGEDCVSHKSDKKMDWNGNIAEMCRRKLMIDSDEELKTIINTLTRHYDPEEQTFEGIDYLTLTKQVALYYSKHKDKFDDLNEIFPDELLWLEQEGEDSYTSDPRYTVDINRIDSLPENIRGMTKGDGEYNCTYKIKVGDKYLVFYYWVDELPFVNPDVIMSAPSAIEVIEWLDTKGIHLCSKYSDGEWYFYISEHPSTAVKDKDYNTAFEKIIEDTLDYLKLIND